MSHQPTGSYQPATAPKDRRAFFDLIRKIAECHFMIGALQETQLVIQGDVATHETRLDTAETDIATHETRLDTAETDIAALETTTADHETRIDTLEVEHVDSGWIAPTLLNSWTNSGSPWQTVQYRKIGDQVYLRGTITGGTVTNGTVVFVLPVGYRPPADLSFATESDSGFGWYLVQSDGDVAIYDAGAASFHFGQSFRID